MSHHQSGKLCLAVVALASMLAGSESLSYGVTGCQPQTPCPCAADGVCRPNRDTWGHYKTRWRSWPGEARDEQPTPLEGAGEQEQALPPFETPKPEQEDLRGPAKGKKERASKDTADEGAAEEPKQLLPGPETLPGLPALPMFDPQGNQLELPSLEDTPPALPESLRQAALSLSMPQQTASHQPLTNTPPALPVLEQPPVQQVSWQQPALGLINPASATVLEPEANTLQQAIYYEASDRGDSAE